MTNEETKARALILSLYESRKDLDRVSPSWLATEAMQTLDPLHASHPIEYAMAHLQFRQLSRSICAGRWEKAEPDQVEQHDLFPVLQRRYPSVRSSGKDEPEYVLLELMSRADVAFNVQRLRAEGVAKLKHADALEAWDMDRAPPASVKTAVLEDA